MKYLELNALGRDKAKTANEISFALELGKNGDRILRALVHEATELNVVICTGNPGYWIPATKDEADETIGRLRSQGLEMIQRAEELSRLVDQKFNGAGTQMSLIHTN